MKITAKVFSPRILSIGQHAGIESGKIFAADPNPGNPLRWTGVTTIKPNRSEAFAMAGKTDPGAADDPLADSSLLQAGAELLEKLAIRSVLLPSVNMG